MLLQRVTRKSLYRFRTSLGGSSSAGCLSQHFVIMRIRLIPIKRNQKTGRKKNATAHHIKHTTITQHSTPHNHHPNAPCYANTHYTDTQYSTTLHYIHTPLPLHTTPTPCYINTPIPTHATHTRFLQQGFPLSLHMLYSTSHRNLYLRLICHTAASPVTQYPVSDYQKKKFTLPHFNQGVTRPRANARKQQTNTEPHTCQLLSESLPLPRAPQRERARKHGGTPTTFTHHQATQHVI